MAKSFCIYTLGCRVNQFESGLLADEVVKNGFTLKKWGENADVCIINSCALTNLAQAKTRNIIRSFLRKNPNSEVCITGCYAQTASKALEAMEGVKWVVGNGSKFNTIKIIAENTKTKVMDKNNFVEPECISSSGDLSDRANIKIQDGCDNFCSYCIIPYARGLPRSRKLCDIVADSKNLVKRGVRELIITGINIAKFNDDGANLLDVIDEVCDIKDLLRLRIGSVELVNFPFEGIFERMKGGKLMPHLHISAQSLSDEMLKIMGRKYSVKDFVDVVELAKRQVPNIAIGTDIICAHPHETQETFMKTYQTFDSLNFAYAHIFTYSKRPNTLAANMANQVPVSLAKAYSDRLRSFAKLKQRAYMQEYEGKEMEILLESKLPNGMYLGYTPNYMQVEVKIAEENLKNKLAKIRVEKILENNSIKGEFLNLI